MCKQGLSTSALATRVKACNIGRFVRFTVTYIKVSSVEFIEISVGEQNYLIRNELYKIWKQKLKSFIKLHFKRQTNSYLDHS